LPFAPASYHTHQRMNLLRNRTHHLIDQLTDLELDTLWQTLEPLYYDLYLLRAIEEAQATHRPGDTLTRDEALETLPLLQARHYDH
jgi:hypothetical protein